jgi:aspartate carbamoyltransferase catalytic subunit
VLQGFWREKTNTVIINAGDGTHEHPTQALLDCYSIKEKLGEVDGKKVVLIGDIKHSRVALSNIFALQKLGAKVMVCGPTTLIPKYIKDLGVEVSHDMEKALKWCNVANVLRIQLERQDIQYFPSIREYAQQFQVNKEILQNIKNPITILHPGPINRGVEITSEIADSDNSIILNQVENGVAIRMAIIYLLAGSINRS